MKPNYCSGGSFVSGRFSSFSSANCKRSFTSSNIEARGSFNNGSNNNGSGLQLQLQQKHQQNLNSSNVVSNNANAARSFYSTAKSSSMDYYSTPNSTSTATSPPSPFIVYRSAKYVGRHARALHTLRSYAKYYVVGSAVLIANRCKDSFYLLCGLLMLLVPSPLWILMIIGLLVTRRLRFHLIKRFYPGVVQLEPRNSYAPFVTSSPGIVNSIIWTRGKLDASLIRNRFQVLFSENPQLKYLLSLKLSSRLGTQVWEACEEGFSLENHIVEAPNRFHNFPIVDEPLKELYRTGSNKSILQKYVSYCVSTPLDSSFPPWKIHVVSYISREDGLKEKTCLVIRMHVALIKNREVQDALQELFMNYSVSSEQPSSSSQKTESDMEAATSSKGNALPEIEELKTLLSLERMLTECKKWYNRIKKTGITHQKSFTIWISLRKKQAEFHSKTAVLSLILIDMKEYFIQSLSNFEAFVRTSVITVFSYMVKLFVVLQACSAIPMIIVTSFWRGSRIKYLGLQKNHLLPHKMLISWSDLIYGDLVKEICGRVEGLSTENAILMACSYALSDYYQLNNIPIPKKVGMSLLNTCSSKIQKTIQVPGLEKGSAVVSNLKSLEEQTQNYPEWKVLALLYITKYLSFLVPTWVSSKVHESIVSSYPFSFTHVKFTPGPDGDSVSDCGHDLYHIRQLYGEVVEEFTLWPLPPISDLGVSITLVQYMGKMRLFVMSPFQSMDTVLTHRFNQYLIKLAEDVGVERSRIPYSRRTSPASTSCSTPQPSFPFMNSMDNLSLVGSGSRISTRT